jgi:hypothetical protein
MLRLAFLGAVGVLAASLACADEPTLETLTKQQSLERAPVAHIKSRTVAARTLVPILERHARELDHYAETAPSTSAALARDKATRADLDAKKLLLELEPEKTEPLLAAGDERAFTILVEWAAGESQEKLVSVLDARIKSDLCPTSLHAKLKAATPGAFLLEGAFAQALGVSWQKAELLLDRQGNLRGVDLRGDERQNLLQELMR